MPKKPCKARRQTERDLKKLDDAIEKQGLIIAARFGECDESIVRMVDDLWAETRRWATVLREYMDEREADGETWEL